MFHRKLCFHQFLGRFTFLVTVYYANTLRRNWANFVFIEEKRLLDRLINITKPVYEMTIFFLLARKAIKVNHT